MVTSSIPAPVAADPDDVANALKRARALWQDGERERALAWLRGAADAADAVGRVQRAATLRSACIALANVLGPSSDDANTMRRPPPDMESTFRGATSAPGGPMRSPTPFPASLAATINSPSRPEGVPEPRPDRLNVQSFPPELKSTQPEAGRDSATEQLARTAQSAKAERAAVSMDWSDGDAPSALPTIRSRQALRVAVRSEVGGLSVRVLGEGEEAPGGWNEALLVALGPGVNLLNG